MDTRSLIEQLHNAHCRDLLLAQLDASEQVFTRHMALSNPLREAEKVGKLSSSLAPDAHDCELLVRIGLIGDFPSVQPFGYTGDTILTWLWTVRHPWFVREIEQHYDSSHEYCRSSALVILASQETAEATDLLIRLIKQYGLPKRTQPRFFWELTKRHTASASRLFPELLLAAGDHLSSVMNYLNVSLEAGQVDAEALRPAAGWVESEAARLLEKIEPLQRSRGSMWRTEEDYAPLRANLGVHLDLLGIIPGTDVALLQHAARLEDPYLLLFSIGSMLKKGVEPEAATIHRCAESLETRADLYKQLKYRDRPDLFPPEFLTFEAFAAAAMAGWLLYPAELGYEPTSLELIAQAEGVKDGEPVVMCLWKFTTEEGETFASASGPYPASRPVEPLWGQDTFSKFTEWDKLTPEQHLEAILDTLDNWKVAWCEGRM